MLEKGGGEDRALNLSISVATSGVNTTATTKAHFIPESFIAVLTPVVRFSTRQNLLTRLTVELPPNAKIHTTA
jgi:hypothetical protein